MGMDLEKLEDSDLLWERMRRQQKDMDHWVKEEKGLRKPDWPCKMLLGTVPALPLPCPPSEGCIPIPSSDTPGVKSTVYIPGSTQLLIGSGP